MYALVPKKSESGLMRAGSVIRIHLSEDGVNSLCGRGKPENFKQAERPIENKNICIFCLIEEQKILNPTAIVKKSPLVTGYVYNLRFSGRFPQYYMRHYLDSEGNPFCNNAMSARTSEPQKNIVVHNCQKCLFIIESLDGK